MAFEHTTDHAIADEAESTLAVVGAATVLVLVAYTAIVTTLADTARDFHASVAWRTWALGGMSLGLAAALLTAGSLADALGRRRVFTLSSAGLALTSALAAVAPSMAVFVAARILQGVAGAGVLAAGLGLIGHAFPAAAARTRATGIWGGMLAGGIALGPVLGPALALASGWRAVYVVEAAGAVALAATALRLPESHVAAPTRLDPPGAVAMLLAMAALTAGLTEGRASWTSPATLTLLAAGVLALAAFATIERARAQPMLDLGLLRRPAFLASIGGAWLTGLGTIALMSNLPVLLEHGLDRGALAAGAVLAIWSLTSMVTAMQARRLPARIHARHRLAAGLLASAAGSAALGALSAGASWWRLVPGLVVAGVGSGLANAALARLAVESVPRASAALGSGANNTARYLGAALGIALVVAILAAGGSGSAGIVAGWNHAALFTALANLAGAGLALACRDQSSRS